MPPESETFERDPGPVIKIVREGLRALAAGPDEVGAEVGAVHYREFDDPSTSAVVTVLLPSDVDRPHSRDLSQYTLKLMEYAQTFLVADRLGAELRITPPLTPPGIDLESIVGRILRIVGRETGEERGTEELRYYPFPHLQAESTQVPFVDFAGFLAHLLTDYLRWSGQARNGVADAARAEIATALGFLVDPQTYAEGDDGGLGWGFVSAQHCAVEPEQSLSDQRHVFPTARAIAAIWYCVGLKKADKKLAARGMRLFPKALKWLRSLADRQEDEGLIPSSDLADPPFVADHLYATEALLTLTDAGIEGARGLALRAIDRFLDELDKGDAAMLELDRKITHRVGVKGHQGYLFYNNRATLGTCLSILCRGLGVLTGEELTSQRERAEIYCVRMARGLLVDRRNPAGLWPRQYLQFHWTLGAVEALLRYVRHAPSRRKLSRPEPAAPAQQADILLLTLAFRLVLARHATPDLLQQLDAEDFRAAVKEARGKPGRHHARALLKRLEKQQQGIEPNPLWLAWMEATRSAALARLRESLDA